MNISRSKRANGLQSLTSEDDMPAGRPTDYNQEISERICEWLAGGKSLRAFCREDDTPGISTITRWIVTHPQFRAQYAQAREAAGYAHGDEVKEVVELLRAGEVDPQTGKAMMDGLKWVAERMAAKAYGPRQTIDNTSSDGSMTPKPALDVSALSAEALAEIMHAYDASKPE